MPTIKTLPSGAKYAEFPSATVVYNFSAPADEAPLAQLLEHRPGVPVAFLATRFDPKVFSQAENTTRTFIFQRGPVDPAQVPAYYPAQWLSPGDIIPAIPGNLSIQATASGFAIDTLPPDPPSHTTL